ncbi:MAG: hypothetical protein M0014_10600 [Actinomycetota bacterium]|nr:hypothetical protein [Actinomycetota bacterium]
MATIEAGLEGDGAVPSKQRHTARRVFQRRVDARQDQGSETTVRAYVAKAKWRRPIPPAAVDFGHVSAILADELVELWMFVMRLSASGRAFHGVDGNEAHEASWTGT